MWRIFLISYINTYIEDGCRKLNIPETEIIYCYNLLDKIIKIYFYKKWENMVMVFLVTGNHQYGYEWGIYGYIIGFFGYKFGFFGYHWLLWLLI